MIVYVGVQTLSLGDELSAKAMETADCDGVFVQCKFSDVSCVAMVHNEVNERTNITVELLNGGSGCVQNVSLEDIFVVFEYSTIIGMIGRKAFSVGKEESECCVRY